MRHFIFFTLALFSVFLITAQTPEITQDTIPFRNDLGIIIIPISFNGVDKEFAFDTGAQRSVAFSWAKEELKRTGKRLNVRSSNDSKTKMRLYNSGTIILGSKKITKHHILTVDDSPIFSCHNIDGVLGVEIMQNFNWKIDYEKQHLIMYEKNYFPEYTKGMTSVDFIFEKERPFVFGTIKDSRIKFLLDTGAGNSDLKKKNYTITDLDKIPNNEMYTGSYDVNGTLTQSKSQKIQFPELQSKDFQFTPILEYGSSKSKIGNSLWKGEALFMSLDSDQLLVSSNAIKEAAETYSCGVIFHEGKMRIASVYINSPAWEAGVRQGDEVVAVNGRSFYDFCSFDTFQREYVKTGKDYTILLQNGKTFTVKKINPFSFD